MPCLLVTKLKMRLSPNPPIRFRAPRFWHVGTALAALFGGLALYFARSRPPGATTQTVNQAAPANLARWPWPHAQEDHPHPGVTHWFATSPDGTTLDLLRFDFAVNPRLRFELYDRDEYDQKPFDNVVNYQAGSLGAATRHLNARLGAAGKGRVVAAWNGLFFGYSHKTHQATAFHVAPVVLNRKVFYPRINHRWTFGVQYVNGKPVFKALYMPDAGTLGQALDFGGGAAQCLIKDGQPLKLQPRPLPGSPSIKRTMPSTSQEAGYIPQFDHMKMTRASLGWSRDNQQLYLLFVKEPSSETQSGYSLRWGLPDGDGWSVADVQRFWLALVKVGWVWNAINSDAGGVGQLTYLQPDGKYLFLPPGATTQRLVCAPDFENAPLAKAGGAIMYFYVRDGKTAVSRRK